MGIFRQFPYSNFHELNLDWILNKIKDLSTEWLSIKDDIDTFYNAADEQLEELSTLTEQTIAEIEQYVTNYFEGTGVEEEIQKYLNILKEEGYFNELLEQLFVQKDNIVCNLKYSNFYPYANEGGYPNGACYIGNNKIAQYLSSDTSNIGKLVIIDTESWLQISESTLELKHGNSLTFDPEENKIYSVSLYNTGSLAVLLNEVKVIDISDYNNPRIVETKRLPMPAGSQGVYSMAYDIINKEFCATCKAQPTGSNIAGQINRMVIYNKELTEIKREVFMDDNLIISNQGIQLCVNGNAYMNYGSTNYRGFCSYDTTTGERINAYTLPKYINGFRYVGELETFIFDYDNNNYYGVSALYGAGVSGTAGLSIYEMGLYKSIPNVQVTFDSYNLYNTQYVTINVQNGKEGVSNSILYAYCFMDAVNILRLNNLRGDIFIADGFRPIGSMDISGITGQIRGTTNGVNWVGNLRIFNCKLRFTYINFSGSINHVYIPNETGNMAIYNSEISMQACTFTKNVLASDSILYGGHRMKPLTALRCLITADQNTLATGVRFIESVPLYTQTT